MLRIEDLKVDSFATTSEAASLPASDYTVPYSLLGSCYGCPSDGCSNVTVCPATGTSA